MWYTLLNSNLYVTTKMGECSAGGSSVEFTFDNLMLLFFFVDFPYNWVSIPLGFYSIGIDVLVWLPCSIPDYMYTSTMVGLCSAGGSAVEPTFEKVLKLLLCFPSLIPLQFVFVY